MSKISNVSPHSYDKNFQKEKSYRKKSCIIFLLLLISLCIVSITSLSSSYVVKVFTNFVFAQGYDQTKLPKFHLSENTNNFENNSTDPLSDSKKDINSENSTLTSDRASTSHRQITLVTEEVYLDIAPGKRVKAWTYNGTVPGPTIRLTEGENLTIKYINKSPIPHTIHFHGNHADINDGVLPQVMPGQTYLYNITGEPAGALMYHCHAPPTSLHIRMGMYGALIVDPKDKPVAPAREFVMVMGEYDLKNQVGFDADYYFINGYADQYVHHPLEINHNDLMRIYLINLGTTIPASFHLHSTTFVTYPSGLWDNLPIHSQTISVAPGDASIVEAKWKYPGNYFFHTHGIPEEKGNMGQIKVVGKGSESAEGKSKFQNSNDTSRGTNSNQSRNFSEPLTRSVSMFDWQYELQKKLQSPEVISTSGHKGIDEDHIGSTKEIGGNNGTLQENESFHVQDKESKAELTTSDESGVKLLDDAKAPFLKNETDRNSKFSISISPGSSSPENKIFYDPSSIKIEEGTQVTWINTDQNMPHTVTSGNPDQGPSGIFDSGIINGDDSMYKFTFDTKGEYNYYCTLHPWMTAKVIVN